MPDSQTVLLLHMDGSDASTTFTDSATTPHTMTARGNAQIDTAQSEFGGASGLFDGTGDYIDTPDSADWSFAAGDFTIDFWVCFNAHTTPLGFMGQYADASNFWLCFKYADSNNYLGMRFVSGGSNVGQWRMTNNWTPNNNQWYHLAFARSGSNYYVFIDGVSQACTLLSALGNTGDVAAVLTVGRSSDNNGLGTAPYELNGWMDEVRISKGIARWTANFTPPTEAYGINARIGAAITEGKSMGVDIFTSTEVGSVISEGEYAGVRIYARNRSGLVKPDDLVLSALREAEINRLASVVSDVNVFAIDTFEASEEATAVSDTDVLGYRIYEAPKSGDAVSDMTINASDVFHAARIGTVLTIADLVGEDVFHAVRIGTVLTIADLVGEDVFEASEIGDAVSDFLLSALREAEITREGMAISDVDVLGADIFVASKDGVANVGNLILFGADIFEASEIGVVQSIISTIAKDIFEANRLGNVISGLFLTAQDVAEINRAGLAIADSEISGNDVSVFNRIGLAESEFMTSGDWLRGLNKYGFVASDFFVSGIRNYEISCEGIVSIDIFSNGQDASILSREGLIASYVLTNGADIFEATKSVLAKSGLAVNGQLTFVHGQAGIVVSTLSLLGGEVGVLLIIGSEHFLLGAISKTPKILGAPQQYKILGAK